MRDAFCSIAYKSEICHIQQYRALTDFSQGAKSAVDEVRMTRHQRTTANLALADIYNARMDARRLYMLKTRLARYPRGVLFSARDFAAHKELLQGELQSDGNYLVTDIKPAAQADKVTMDPSTGLLRDERR